MKAQSTGSTYSKGSSTLEILIAFAVLILTLTAVIMIGFGNQSVSVDAETNNEALYRAQKILEDARAASRDDFFSVTTASSSETISGLTYKKLLVVNDITPCKKQATSTVLWSLSPLRTQSIDLSTFLTDIAGTLALGGDCATQAPNKKWDNPQRFAFDTLSPGKSTAIDVLSEIAYLGQDKKPFLSIADTQGAILDVNNRQDFFVSFDNSFNSDGKTIDQINDIDVYVDPSSGKTYALIAMASSTAQFAILDVTDIKNPKIIAKRQLTGVLPTGSQPGGHRIYYYQNKGYIVTRETSGPEFHIFDLSNPNNPLEIGTGTKLNGCTPPNGTTVNDFVIQNGVAYMAAEKENCELLIYDVSNPASIKYLAEASVDLPGNQDGFSIFILGNKLYFGRQSTGSGPEFYIFNTTNVLSQVNGLPTIGVPKEIGSDVIDIYIVGNFGFLVTTKTKEEFQVYNISVPANISVIKKYNFGNIIQGGLDYENDFIYTTGDATPNFQILYSPT